MNAMSRLGPCAHISHQDEEQNESKKKIEASWPFLSFSHWPSRDRFIGVESLSGEMQSGGLFRTMIKKFTSQVAICISSQITQNHISKPYRNVSPDPSPR
jgi:hypothetical protein